MKQLTANSRKPKPTITRESTSRVVHGTKGKIKSYGSPYHMMTSPICIAS
jgi:hypothetical protein